MVERKDVKATVKTTAQVAQPTEAETGAEPTVPEKVEAKARAVVPVKTEAAPVEKEARTAPAEKTTVRKIVSKTAAKKAAAPEETVKKEVAPKAEAKKETAPKAAKGETMKKTPAGKVMKPKVDVHLQFGGKDLVAEDALDQTVKAFEKAHKGIEIKTIDPYIVADEGAAHYVVNGENGDNYRIILQFGIKS